MCEKIRWRIPILIQVLCFIFSGLCFAAELLGCMHMQCQSSLNINGCATTGIAHSAALVAPQECQLSIHFHIYYSTI